MKQEDIKQEDITADKTADTNNTNDANKTSTINKTVDINKIVNTKSAKSTTEYIITIVKTCMLIFFILFVLLMMWLFVESRKETVCIMGCIDENQAMQELRRLNYTKINLYNKHDIVYCLKHKQKLKSVDSAIKFAAIDNSTKRLIAGVLCKNDEYKDSDDEYDDIKTTYYEVVTYSPQQYKEKFPLWRQWIEEKQIVEKYDWRYE